MDLSTQEEISSLVVYGNQSQLVPSHGSRIAVSTQEDSKRFESCHLFTVRSIDFVFLSYPFMETILWICFADMKMAITLLAVHSGITSNSFWAIWLLTPQRKASTAVLQGMALMKLYLVKHFAGVMWIGVLVGIASGLQAKRSWISAITKMLIFGMNIARYLILIVISFPRWLTRDSTQIVIIRSRAYLIRKSWAVPW